MNLGFNEINFKLDIDPIFIKSFGLDIPNINNIKSIESISIDNITNNGIILLRNMLNYMLPVENTNNINNNIKKEYFKNIINKMPKTLLESILKSNNNYLDNQNNLPNLNIKKYKYKNINIPIEDYSCLS